MNRQIAAVALAGLAVLGTGVVDVTTSGQSATKKTAAKVVYPKQWDKRVLPLVEFVQNRRGLKFKHPVPVSFLGDAEFDKQVAVPAPESKKDKADLATFLGTLRALGLVSGDVDLSKQLDTLQKSSVIGLYVPDKHAVFVRGTSLDPYTRVTLAHELTHVLQDQYYDLAKLRKDAPGGDDTAVTALIEGDAVRIQDLYQKQLSSSDQKQFAKVEAGDAARSKGAADVPEILSDFLSFPYVFGPVLLATLTQEDGNDAVDRAFRQPPSEEAQIIDPITHPLSERPQQVPAPSLPAGGKATDKVAPFGQVSLFEVLGSRLDYATSWKAVAGWKGDAYLPYTLAGKACVAIDVQTDSSDTLRSALQQWATRIPGAAVATDKGLVTVRSCDPGPEAAAPPKAATSAFAILEARAEIIHEVLTGGGDYAAGRCVADGVIAALGPEHQADLTADSLSPPRLSAIQQLFRTTAQHCRDTGSP